MSHFTTIRTQLTDKQALAQGIENLLKEKGIAAVVEVLHEATLLINKFDEDDERYGEIIIRHSYLSTEEYFAKVDVGYLWNEALLKFELQTDPYDFTYNLLGKTFGTIENFNNAVQLAHDKIRLYEKLRVNYPVTEWVYGEETVSQDGTITLEITKKPELIGAWF